MTALGALVALATCAELPNGEEADGDLLVSACAAAGVTARHVPWTAEGDWNRFDLVVLRSTWDYSERRAEFLRWTRTVPRLANPAPVVRWNSAKTYLRDLSGQGVPVVPTTFAGKGEEPQFPDGQFVVKPAEGAGSLGAGRFSDPVAARQHVRALHDAGRTVMVQPYLDAVDAAGETALVFIAGEYSHAIRKGPMLPAAHVHPLGRVERDRLFVAEEIVARAPRPAEQDVARTAVKAVAAVTGATDLLYARVDLLPTDASPVVGEVELIEPSLFLQFADGAAERFAAAIADRARQ